MQAQHGVGPILQLGRPHARVLCKRTTIHISVFPCGVYIISMGARRQTSNQDPADPPGTSSLRHPAMPASLEFSNQALQGK